MKKWMIFWLLLVATITFILTRPTKYYDKGHVVTEEEANQYREGLSEYNILSEEEIDEMVDNYIRSNTREPSEKEVKGSEFKPALEMAIFVSSIACIIPFIMSLIRGGQYNERYGANFGESTPNDPFPDLSRFLRGK